MAISLSDNQVRLLRQRAQLLIPQQSVAITDVAQVVKDLCGIQAQDASAAALAIRVRSTGLLNDDVERARVQERSVIRTWGQRGTLHLLATEDLDWLLPLFSPVFIAGNRRRYVELGLDEDILARGVRAIYAVLAKKGPLTRDELIEQLATHDIRLTGQARPYLIWHAALKGLICLGPDRGAKPTYVLLSDWVGQGHQVHSLSQESAHAELARRYLKAYSPATPEDLAAWSGMPMSTTRAAWQRIADQRIEVEIADRPAWMLKTYASWLDEPPIDAPVVRLLPGFDTYLLGYKKRDLLLPPQHAKRINAGGGLLKPTLLVNGRVVGTWKSKRQKNRLDVLLEPFDQLAPEVQPGVEAEVADLGRFLGVQTTSQLMPSPS
ncbi:MAG: winged helix DNA-binding domain-containing protein [Chloroflexi bacterium]|nr:MAG: winged helix DNA-binding domain-containing protein [Chloroflexota bacterium]